jgi:hypothetical protein
MQWISGVQGAFSQKCWKGGPYSREKIVSHGLQMEACLALTKSGQLEDVNQFSIITELLGTPPEDVIQSIASENVSEMANY